MQTRYILILLGLGVAAVAVWYFFIRKKPTVTGVAGSSYSPGPVRPAVYAAPVAGVPSIPPSAPVGTTGGAKVTVGGAINQGVALAATAGCAAAAGAYTGGAALPLCGLAGPLAVQGVQALGTGAKAVGGVIASGAKALCFWC
jgi:hypothetical protein